MTTHAILLRSTDNNRLYLVWEGNVIFVEYDTDDEPLSLFDLAQHCEGENAITHLWVHPNTGMSKTVPDVYAELQARGYDILPQYDVMNNLVSLHGYRKRENGRKQRFNIMFVEHSSWDWQDLTPNEMMTLIHDLENNLGVAVSGSPSGTGMRYLQKVTEKRPLWLAKPDLDLSTLPWNQAARPLIWQRAPTVEELDQEYYIAVDKNAAHPRAGKEEQFGYGSPVRWATEVQFDASLPGMWNIDIDEEREVEILSEHIPLIPAPVWPNASWVATPIVKLLQKLEVPFTVNEAWIFPRHAHIFRGWVDNLWDFRREREGYEKDAYKSIMNDTLGLTRSSKLGTNSFKFRPDWNMTIVAGTRAAMYYNIMKYALRGYYPIMVQLDALYYATNDSNPLTAIPDMLNHTNSLGGYKVKFHIPMSATEDGMTVRAILCSNMAQSKKLQLLNKVAERYGY